MQPEKISEIRAWFQKAFNDIRAAEHNLIAEPPLLDDVAFHCQQAIEKSIKGFLVAHNIEFKKIHDLDELSESAEQIDSTLTVVLKPAKELTVYATMYRYPSVDDLTIDDLKDDIALAKKVFNEILSKLPAEVNPVPKVQK